MTKTKPAIFYLPDCSWGWVSLAELAEIAKMNPKRVLKNFFGLSKNVESMLIMVDDGQNAQPLQIAANGEVLNNEDVRLDIKSDVFYNSQWIPGGFKFHFYLVNDEAEKIFVPAGWAQDVLEARGQGFTGVQLVHHTHQNDQEKDCPDGALTCAFMDSGFYSAVGVKDALPDEKTEARQDRAEEIREMPIELRRTPAQLQKRWEILEGILNHKPWFTPEGLNARQLQEWAKAMKVLMPINTEACEAQGFIPSQAALSSQKVVPLVLEGMKAEQIIELACSGEDRPAPPTLADETPIIPVREKSILDELLESEE
jgi:hypothetical protein